jgi:thiol-disulfide isomerase/thioredoxin
MKAHLKKLDKYIDTAKEAFDFPEDHDWLNLPAGSKLSFERELKNKVVVIDFWCSCCINCIHVMAEMEYLEQKFKEFPEVVFIGCHSAKFDGEKDHNMLRQ